MKYQFDTPYGPMAVESNDGAIIRLHFPDYIPDDFVSDSHPDALMQQTRDEVVAYLNKEIRAFSVPIDAQGTAFMQQAWQMLCDIPYGEVMSYGEVAKAMGCPGGARAVGMACRNNPIPLIIPCHRVLSQDGKLTGFFGGGLTLKQRLLDLEREIIVKGRESCSNRSTTPVYTSSEFSARLLISHSSHTGRSVIFSTRKSIKLLILGS